MLFIEKVMVAIIIFNYMRETLNRKKNKVDNYIHPHIDIILIGL